MTTRCRSALWTLLPAPTPIERRTLEQGADAELARQCLEVGRNLAVVAVLLGMLFPDAGVGRCGAQGAEVVRSERPQPQARVAQARLVVEALIWRRVIDTDDVGGQRLS
jgi:hypothetical protein